MIEYKVKVCDDITKWYLNGLLHRENGPAVERSDGSKDWFLNGKEHRTDGPAVEWSDGSKEWYLNGKEHRTDGPAVEWSDGSKEWYLNGKEYTEEEFLEATQPAKELTIDEIEKLLGHRVKVVK